MAAAEIDEAAGTRQRILTAAYTLFYRHGFVRVALEAIAAEAGVTKRTLYYHFRSKDDLLAAALELHSGLALARIREWAARWPAEPAAMVDALFAELARWAGGPRFEGAGYTRLVMELADLPGHPARAVAHRLKATVESWLAGELAARGVDASSEAARRIQLLLEGAMVMMLIHADARYAWEAAEMAKAAVVTPSSAP
jgi:AcrR family transcriptional regulator